MKTVAGLCAVRGSMRWATRSRHARRRSNRFNILPPVRLIPPQQARTFLSPQPSVSLPGEREGCFSKAFLVRTKSNQQRIVQRRKGSDGTRGNPAIAKPKPIKRGTRLDNLPLSFSLLFYLISPPSMAFSSTPSVMGSVQEFSQGAVSVFPHF